MRSKSDLEIYARDIAHTDDEELSANLDRLISGDERVRQAVEDALDQIDTDLRKYTGR